ncbi:MAG: hypothetical protein MUE31_00510 [Candidatus Nanopelagicales bacterium]|jgi:hypothetical protein|nr:hypothetical protein [Candidatus Nanopelagicales bacterium]
MPRLLVSNGDNEFVGMLIDSLATKHGVDVTPLVDAEDFEPGSHSHVLVTMPTDDQASARAKALVDALADEHVLFIANELDPEHHAVMDHIKASGLAWTIVHPVSMMDFSFAALPPQITMAGVVFGISGTAPIGFVAASDIMHVLSVIIAESGHEGQEYVCTGPEAIDMPGVVAELSAVIGRKIDYINMPEDELKTLMVQYGRQDPEVIERLVMSHLRAWRDGHADVVTTTVAEITGQEPISVREWFADHADDFSKSPSLAQRAASAVVKARYRDRIMGSG